MRKAADTQQETPMTDDLIFEITDGGDIIKIQPIGHPYLDSVHSLDKNCVRSYLTVKSGAFGGQFKADIFTFEFEELKQELRRVYKDLSGEFNFRTREHELELKVKGDGNGHFTVDCTAIDHPTWGAQLNFEITFDQTYIPDLVRQLNDITRAFPITGDDYRIKNEY